MEEELMDIYFTDSYCKLYETPNNILDKFIYKCEYGTIMNIFLKNIITPTINNNIYYDISTPYGYGGPIILKSTGNDEKLVDNYIIEFTKYCNDNNIICEFIRFHPILKNHLQFKNKYNTEYIRNTVGTNIFSYDDPVQSEFSKKCRQKIRKCISLGMKATIDYNCDTLYEFIKIYRDTMDRNEANNFYYFDDNYFERMKLNLIDNMFIINIEYENKIIASAIYFHYGEFIHAHLSGTLKEYLKNSPANMIRYAATIWAKDNNIKYFHHGGGTTNSKDDSLYKFKKGFGLNTEFEFHTGKNIYNKSIYSEMVNLKCKNVDSSFFPLYRAV